MKRFLFTFLLLIMAFIPAALANAAKAEVTDVRWVTRNDAAVPFVRVVLDLDKPVKATASIDSSGLTTVVTLKNTSMAKAPKRLTMNADIAATATVIEAGNDIKVSIQTPRPLDVEDVKVFPLKADKANKKPPRLVIDIKKKVIEKVVRPARYKVTPGLGDKVIVIDPGHGGSDPGAIGPHKVMEKNVTLSIAEMLKTQLEAKGAKVYMTRYFDKDVYKPLAEGVDELQARVNIAEKYDADAFISLHIDSFSNPAIGGISAYYNGKTPYDKILAASILEQIGTMPGFNGSRGVKPANFYIMKHSSMPTTLLELGFLSNPKEEALLTEDSVQKAFAKGIAQGVADYFNRAQR